MHKKEICLAIIVSLLLLPGCAEIQPFEAPAKILKQPLGTDPIRLGMVKEEVKKIWGPPAQVNKMGMADQWGTPKEEWIYKSRHSKIPINKGYLKKTKYLYFEGDVLTSFGEEPEQEDSSEK